MENNKQQEHVTKKIICNALLVEDDGICCKVLENQLSQLGYQVEIAKNARTAIQFLNTTSYNLVLIDLGLPDQPGDAVIQAARKCKLNQLTPLVVCTAHADGEVEQECVVLGADQVLIKPILTKNLQQTIDDCLLMPAYRRKYKFQLKIL
ncbi:MAG: response regulator [Rickettsia endosymbiont of Ixodes persulcatus]|nr:response regulator [Rickettsia endosymbiont of Ixodes persulcatus]